MLKLRKKKEASTVKNELPVDVEILTELENIADEYPTVGLGEGEGSVEEAVARREEGEKGEERADSEDSEGDCVKGDNWEEDDVERKEEEVPCGITEEFRIASEAFAKGKGLEIPDVEAGMNKLQEIGEGWRDGTLSVEMLEIVLHGLMFDRAVAEAREAGEIAGRNLQIEEKYMHPVESDGIPHLGGSNARRSADRIASIFDLARNA